MNRGRIVTGFVLLLLAAGGWWIASNTYWVTETVSMPLQGEAARNPFHAAQLFVRRLGASPQTDTLLDTRDPRDVIVLNRWGWDLSAARRQQIERWVEAGGRLVVDESLRLSGEEFQRWSAVQYEYIETTAEEDKALEEEAARTGETPEADPCIELRQVGESPLRDELVDSRYFMCNSDERDVLTSQRQVSWGLRGRHGLNAARMAVGKGSVTVIRGYPFTDERFLKGDHPGILVAAAQLRGADRVHFLTESEHPSLLALIWMYGAPVVGLAAAWLLLALWRNGVRFGSIVGTAIPARRSLAEQIRGTGQFALRFGGGTALHRATRRALLETASARIPGFHAMVEADRVRAMAAAARIGEAQLGAALDPGSGAGRELLSSIALLESARRAILSFKRSPSHAT